MILTEILLLFVILNLKRTLSEINICDEGEYGYLNCNEKNAKCVFLNSNNSNFSCECETGYEFHKQLAKCIEDLCTPDHIGYRFCHSEKANCQNDPSQKRGFICICEEGKTRDVNAQMCVDIVDDTDISESENHTDNSVILKQFNTTYSDINESTENIESHKYTTSTKEVISIHTDLCLKNNCMKNTTCVAVKNSYTCKCDFGYELKPEYLILIERCSDSCDTAFCKGHCDDIKQRIQCHKIMDTEAIKDDTTNKISV